MARLSLLERRSSYRTRFLLALAVVLLGCIAGVQLWPSSPLNSPAPTIERSRETAELQVVEPTRHEEAPPPPPATHAPPVEVPDDEMLSRETLDLTLPEGTGPENGLPRSGDASGHSSSSDGDVSGRPPRALHMVEPTYPEDAREHGVRASLELKLTVSEEGHVEQCEVTGRSYRAADGKPAESTKPQGYGLSEAACAAARQWRFRPAKVNGAPTQAQTQITISFGEP